MRPRQFRKSEADFLRAVADAIEQNGSATNIESVSVGGIALESEEPAHMDVDVEVALDTELMDAYKQFIEDTRL